MKRLLSLILTFSLLVGTTMTVSASEVREDGDVTVPVSMDVRSSYCVNIPANIDLNGTDPYYFTASMVSITDNETVSIYPPKEEVRLQNEFGNTETLHFNVYNINESIQDKGRVAIFKRGDTTSKIGFYGQLDAINAGHYTGNVVFTIRLENESLAGQ